MFRPCLSEFEDSDGGYPEVDGDLGAVEAPPVGEQGHVGVEHEEGEVEDAGQDALGHGAAVEDPELLGGGQEDLKDMGFLHRITSLKLTHH